MAIENFIDLKVNKTKLNKIKKLFQAKTDQEVIDQILDDLLYNAEMMNHMKNFEGKGNFTKVYE
ncbi:hypothetical protein H8E88_04060 [candidate division KSB1 bacterium]|nr:hypothetical protein [candidate division KSB1 bacterium]MBL7095114.1 hypothetical protein [candidate division KSB1 bacterium]